jgi:hypothetical protein
MSVLRRKSWAIQCGWCADGEPNFWRRGMPTAGQTLVADTRIRSVSVTEHELVVGLVDGRTISIPLAWYPSLSEATPQQRAHWEVCGGSYGIHWPDLDEDLSTEGMLLGEPIPRRAA